MVSPSFLPCAVCSASPISVQWPAISAQATSYGFNSITVDECGNTLVPGDIISVSWTLNANPGSDTCFVSIRPFSDLVDDDAYVAKPPDHPSCVQGGVNIQIPSTPLNSSFPYNNSYFLVRINTPVQTHADSCVFKLAESYSKPWSTADKLSLASTVIGSVGLIGSVFSGLEAWRAKRQARRATQEADIARQAVGL
ncbi:hypothetical protein AAWM_08203 [Aspergillus awamori]|uniref:Uncharacterized protein n=1 Tax=Aspergillus awamori TaxID=105351 RepID=A0A401L1B8_ASPAW|nr:hypothetical protein AAWM_08203 [Aspergillus awamori]